MSAVLDRPPRHLIQTDEYLRMAEAGVFAPDARLELIEGEILEMAPIGSPHAAAVRLLNRRFIELVGSRASVSSQSPLVVGTRSVPEPDLALLIPRPDDYRKSHPTAPDTFLVVEVSDSTVRFDVQTKAPLYAAAGAPECWVVDLDAKCVHVFRDGESLVVHEGTIAPRALPDVRISLAELFPE